MAVIIPNWVKPTDVLESIRTGAHIGLQLAQQQQAAAEAEANRQERAQRASEALQMHGLETALRLMEMRARNAELAGYHKESVDARKAADVLRGEYQKGMLDVARRNATTAENRELDTLLNSVGESGSPTYETPFPEYPWIKVARFGKSGLHVIHGTQPINAMQRARVLDTFNKTQAALDDYQPGTPQRKFVEDQLNILRQSLNPQQPQSASAALATPQNTLPFTGTPSSGPLKILRWKQKATQAQPETLPQPQPESDMEEPNSDVEE